MEFLLFCLLYAFWENGFPAPSLAVWLLPLAFLLLAPLVHRLRLRWDRREGGLDLRFRLVAFHETLGFPARTRWFCLGFAAFLCAYSWGSLAALSRFSRGQTISFAVGFALGQLSVLGLFLLPVLYVLVNRGTVSLFGDIFFAGEMVILSRIGRAHHILSDVDAFPAALGWSTLPWLVVTLACAALLALFLRRKRQDRPSLA